MTGSEPVRVAIYSRKSKWTGKGDSIENQLAMCREYILANIGQLAPEDIYEYEDEGFSGKNTQRPQFQRMMSDIKKQHYDYLVCYQLDRLGRNLLDLVNLIEELNKLGTAFISIKERFDTSTPIGRAMMFFTGVLAQMEREQIAERVRDNMMMLAKSGRWLGGTTPLGFTSKRVETVVWNNKARTSYRLSVNEAELDMVRFIYHKYLEKQSLTWINNYFHQHNIRTRMGKEYQISTIRDILTNPVYCTADPAAYEYFKQIGCQVYIDEEELDGIHGLIGYGKTSSRKYKNHPNEPEEWIIAVSKHQGIISGEDWVRVQRLLQANKSKGTCFRRVQNPLALLPGLLYCSCGYPMRPKNYPADRLDDKGQRTFAYLCSNKERSKGKQCSVSNIHGNTLDHRIWTELLSHAKLEDRVYDSLKSLAKELEEEEITIHPEEALLIKALKEKKSSIHQLILALSKCDGDETLIGYVKEQIEILDQECKELQEKIEMKAGLVNQESFKAADREQQDELMSSAEKLKRKEQITALANALEILSIQEKREYLRNVLEKVVWDGVNAHVYLKGNEADNKVRRREEK